MFPQATILRILIASPSDLQQERDRIHYVFNRWNTANLGMHLTPVMWESSSVPELGDHPQHILDRRLIPSSELLIAMFWSKIGTPTPTAPSGTIEEIREFIKLKGAQRVMLYFCDRPLEQSPTTLDLTAIALLQEFKEEMRAKGLYESFVSREEFERKLYNHLDLKISDLIHDKLPVPKNVPQLVSEIAPQWCRLEDSDTRLNQPLDFGCGLQTIVDNIYYKVYECMNVGGATNDNYLNYGKHIFYSAGYTLTCLLNERPYDVPIEIRKAMKIQAERLTEHGKQSSNYIKKPLKQFYRDGMLICDDLKRLISKK